jgi:hypothetical protein
MEPRIVYRLVAWSKQHNTQLIDQYYDTHEQAEARVRGVISIEYKIEARLMTITFDRTGLMSLKFKKVAEEEPVDRV